MPSVKDYKSKKPHHASGKPERRDKTTDFAKAMAPRSAKRRPGREAKVDQDIKRHQEFAATAESDLQIVDVESGETQSPRHDEPELSAAAENLADESPAEEMSGYETETENTSQTNKIHIDFFGSQVLRSRFPKVFSNLESVATDWVHGGDFKDLQVGHPLADFVATTGLKRAKELEKQILESPTTEKVAMKVFEAGLKAQGIFEGIKGKLKK